MPPEVPEAPPEVLLAAARGCPSGLLGKLACASRELRAACLAEARRRARADRAGVSPPHPTGADAASAAGAAPIPGLPPVSVRLLASPGEVDWAVSCGLRPDGRLSWALAAAGEVAALARAAELGAPLTSGACAAAAGEGRIDALAWLKERGALGRGPWDVLPCAAAAEEGRLDALAWLRRNGFPWDAWTCAMAADGGHLDVLRWARENGCPWDCRTCAFAAAAGSLETLAWARENGAPWDWMTCAYSLYQGRADVLLWALERGCPWCTCAPGAPACRCAERLAAYSDAAGHRDAAAWIRRELAGPAP